MELLIKILLNALAIFAAAYFLKPKVQIQGFGSAVILAVVLAILNGTLGTILKAISLPLNIITLGLFSFVINALMILVAAYFLKSFTVKGFWPAFIMAILLGVFNWILHGIIF